MILRKPHEFYRTLSQVQQDHLADNLAADLAGISPETRRIVLGYLSSADPELGERVSRQIGT